MNYCLVIREATICCYLMTVYEHMSDCSNLYTARRNTKKKTVSELFVVCLNHSVAACIPCCGCHNLSVFRELQRLSSLFFKQSSCPVICLHVCCIGIHFNLMLLFLFIKLFMKTLNRFILFATRYLGKEIDSSFVYRTATLYIAFNLTSNINILVNHLKFINKN